MTMVGKQTPALAANLKELVALIESDIQMVLAPQADHEGNILHQDHLISLAERAKDSAQKLVEISSPSPEFSDYTNDRLTHLRTAAEGFVSLAAMTVQSANAMPATVEEFYILLGPVLRSIEASRSNILGLASSVERGLIA